MRLIAAAYLWATLELLSNEAKPIEIQIEAAQVEGGWLQVALKNAPPKAAQTAGR